MPTGIKVKDAMRTSVVTARSSQSVQEGAKMMRDKDVGSLVIIDNHKPMGIVTREDIINKVTAKNQDASKILLRDVMSRTLIVCTPADDLADVARKMTKYGYERLPVVESGKVIGMISTREVAKVAPAAVEILRERLFIQEPEKFAEEGVQEGECELCGNYSAELRSVNDRWVCTNCREEAEEL